MREQRVITRVVIALNLVVYVAMGLQSGLWMDFRVPTEILFGANYAPLVHEGQWFRLLTSVFLHGGALHVAMNMIALHQVGVLLEPFYGRLRLVVLYLVCGVAASLASLLLHRQPAISVGASGAIAGLIGAGAVAGQLVATDGGRAFRNAMLRWAAIIVVFGVVVPRVDNAAHIGGFLSGIAGGLALSPGLRRRGEGSVGAGGARETWLAVALLVVIVGAGFALALRAAGPLIDSGLANPPA